VGRQGRWGTREQHDCQRLSPAVGGAHAAGADVPSGHSTTDVRSCEIKASAPQPLTGAALGRGQATRIKLWLFWVSIFLHACIVTAPPITASGVERLALQPIAITGIPIVVVPYDNAALVMAENVFVLEDMGVLHKHGF